MPAFPESRTSRERDIHAQPEAGMKVLGRIAVAGWVAALMASAVQGQPAADVALSIKVDAAVRQQMQEQRIPGLSLAVVRDGKIIKAKGYGLANLEMSVPVTPQTIFEAGSITKQFTATAVMQLVEEGKIGLDDSITKYFPEAPPTWAAVTIRHLLSHTSGVPDYWGDTEKTLYSKGIIDFRREYTEDEVARAYFPQALDFRPGEKWSYSSTGYNLLGFLIHRVTGVVYGDLLRERIFAPLDMSATRVFSGSDLVANRASGYDLVNRGWKNTGSWMSQSVMATADGGLLTNVLDLAKWDAALYSGKVLKRSGLDAMWTPVKLNSGARYPGGLGWFVTDAHGHHVIWHTGGGYGFYAAISRYVDDGLTIIVMTNIDETHTDVLKIAGGVASIYVPETAGANPIKDW